MGKEIGYMNCDCLSKLLKDNDKTYNCKETKNGEEIVQELVHSNVNFSFFGQYRYSETLKKRLYIDRIQKFNHNLPFFFCPFCGKKTKNELSEGSYYHKILKSTDENS